MDVHYFSDKLYEILIRHLLDEKKLLPAMVEAAKHDNQIRREVEMLIVDEVYRVGR